MNSFGSPEKPPIGVKGFAIKKSQILRVPGKEINWLLVLRIPTMSEPFIDYIPSTWSVATRIEMKLL